MILNNYFFAKKSYPIGGLINGEIDGMVLTGGNQTDIYDITLEGYSIALSEHYGLLIKPSNTLDEVVPVIVSKISLGDKVKVHGDINFAKVVSIIKREGKHITIPRSLFVLNNVYVTTDFSKEASSLAQNEKKKTKLYF